LGGIGSQPEIALGIMGKKLLRHRGAVFHLCSGHRLDQGTDIADNS